MSIIAIMGSGETAPTMTGTHRRLLERTYGGTAPDQGPAVLLDTTFGFQANADDLVARTAAYFATSIGRQVEPATWRRADADLVTRERTLSQLARARWAFAGPGSPTYALHQWLGTQVPEALAGVVRRGGTLVVGSAAACTVGSHALPVYEVYKAGADLSWEPGLDLLGQLAGLTVAVVPHYDNREGGTYDTRYCYMGAERLRTLAGMLPDEVGILGVDEHTAVVVDLDARTVEVTGNGVMTLLAAGISTEISAGTTLTIDEVAAVLRGQGHGGGSASEGATPDEVGAADRSGRSDHSEPATSLRALTEQRRADFDAATRDGQMSRSTEPMLALEDEIHTWAADTLQSDDLPQARRTLRAMIVDLGDAAGAPRVDVHAVVAPVVDAVLAVRSSARTGKDWAMSDALRDALADGGVDVRDTADGQTWQLRDTIS